MWARFEFALVSAASERIPAQLFDLTLLLAASHVRFAQVLQQTKFHALNDFFRKSPQRVEATEATASLFCYYVRKKSFTGMSIWLMTLLFSYLLG